jgi:L-amino acid N-acyltransferase YncA
VQPENRHGRSVIRDALESDLQEIVGIYNASIPGRLATADTEPVSVESRRAWLQDRDFSRHPVWVLERRGDPDDRDPGPNQEGDPDRVVGWLSFNKFYGRPAYAATAEVSIYVHPACQRGGIATWLMQAAVARASSLGISTLLGFVFAHNQGSVSLCRKFGFEEWGHLPRVAVIDGVERDLLILGLRLVT